MIKAFVSIRIYRTLSPWKMIDKIIGEKDRIFHFSYHAVDGRRFVSAHIDHVERAMGSVRAVFPLALFFGNMLSVYYFVFRFVQ